MIFRVRLQLCTAPDLYFHLGSPAFFSLDDRNVKKS